MKLNFPFQNIISVTGLVILLICIIIFVVQYMNNSNHFVEHFTGCETDIAYDSINPYTLTPQNIKNAVSKAHNNNKKLQFYVKNTSNPFQKHNAYYTNNKIYFATTDALIHFIQCQKKKRTKPEFDSREYSKYKM